MRQISGIKGIMVSLLAIGVMSLGSAQDTTKITANSKATFIQTLVDSQNFVFVPQLLSTMRGTTRQLTSYYDISVSRDTIISYLPYFGRAHMSPADPANVGFDFTSTNFEYSKNANKKGGWDILIKPKDNTTAQQLMFRIFDNGSASLSITSSDRDAISYQGYIKERT